MLYEDKSRLMDFISRERSIEVKVVTSAIMILVEIFKALLFGTTNLGLSKRKIFSSSMSLKKWFDCKFEVTVIQIYGMRSFNFLHLILILYRH